MRLPSMRPGFRSCYVRHIWVRDRSLFIAWRGGGRILGGSLNFWEKEKEVSVITENPKGGITENRGGTTQICLENDKRQDKTDKGV